MNFTTIYLPLKRRFFGIKYPFYSPNNPPMPCDSPYISVDSLGGARILTLDRPKALNALDLSMIESISSALSFWERSPECRVVILKSPFGSRAFCAGGDILHIALSRRKPKEQLNFFTKEYSLNHQIGTYSKPIVSILDGYTSKLFF